MQQHKASLVEIFQTLVSQREGQTNSSTNQDNKETNDNLGDKVKAGIDKVIDYLS